MLSKDGLSPDTRKVELIQQWPTPMNQTELQSFLGTVNYLSHLLVFLSDLCMPLQVLPKKGTEFIWTTVHQSTFDQIKLHVSNDVKLQFYDANKPLYIEVDTFKKGIGAVMLQGDSIVPNTAKSDEIPMNLRPISYASKNLLSAKSNYSNIEHELLGLLFAITRLKHFTYGRLVHVITYHKPLVFLFRKSLVDSSPRMTKMLIQLLDYTLDVRYQPGAQMHLSDAISRLLMQNSNTGSTIKNLDVSVHAIEELTGFNSLSVAKICQHTSQDPVMQQLIQHINDGFPKSSAKCTEVIHPFFSFRNELSVCNGIVLKGHNRIIVPESL